MSTNNVVQFRKPTGRVANIQVHATVGLFTVSTIEMLTVLQWLEMTERQEVLNRSPNHELKSYLHSCLNDGKLLFPVVDIREDMLTAIDALPPFPTMQLDLQQAMQTYFTAAKEG